jgi:hypothetical protein
MTHQLGAAFICGIVVGFILGIVLVCAILRGAEID